MFKTGAPGACLRIRYFRYNGRKDAGGDKVKRYRKPIQYIILAVVLLVGGYAIGQSFLTPTKALKPGSKAPAFELLGLDGQAHSLDSYRGKPLVVNFWGTFCPPCRNEMPALQAQYDKWKDQGVQLVGINLSEDRVSVGSFLRSYDINFPVLLDKNKKTERKYGLKEYPTTFFISADGKIQDIVIGGPMSEETIGSRIALLLGKD